MVTYANRVTDFHPWKSHNLWERAANTPAAHTFDIVAVAVVVVVVVVVVAIEVVGQRFDR